ncbi:hypothetical protein [Nonomuraea rubra]|uniref:hypothetical protein n=1 Tax=Nonomuraea rubra TaxID=46180 RepID=UPI0033C11697
MAMLRHASLGITADLYTAVLPEVAHVAAEASAAVVPRTATSQDVPATSGLPNAFLLLCRLLTVQRNAWSASRRRPPSRYPFDGGQNQQFTRSEL